MKTILTILALSGLAISYNNCGVGFESLSGKKLTKDLATNSGSDGSSNNTDSEEDDTRSAPPPVAPEPGESVSISSLGQSSMKLGETQKINGSLRAGDDFNGTVNLSIDRTQLNAKDLENNVNISIQPSSLQMSAGQSNSFVVTITTDTMSPSFDLSNVSIIVKDAAGERDDVTTNLSLKVEPIFEVKMLGASDVPDQRWDPAVNNVSFRDHSAGLKLRFINTDTQGHVVHGDGAIPHGSIGNPLQQGQAYEVDIEAGTVDDASFYYHDIENGGDARDMNFGVANNAAAATLKMAANAQVKLDNARTPASEKPKGTCHDPVGTD